MPRFLPGWGLVVVFALLGMQPTFAQETVSFQGRLTDADGAPVADDTYTVRFQLFETPTGGSAQWEESHTVTTQDGVFSTLLGTETVLDPDAFETMPYLALTIDGQALAPRTLLTAVPYAMKSFRLNEEALVAGQNVTITQRADGALQIGAAGGGTGGLSSVATDATIAGNGTSGSPLGLADGSVTGEKLSNNALVAGVNVDIVRRGNGSLEISAASSGGGLTQVASDATLSGEGTAGSPLGLADGAVTEMKLADGSVTGAKAAVPLVLTGSEASGVMRVEHSSGGFVNIGGDGPMIYAENANGNLVMLARSQQSVYGQHSGSGKSGELGLQLYAVRGTRDGSLWGALGTSSHAGYFQGNVHVTGNLTKGGGAFKIDHPLDPEGKYLSHSFVESPDMKNVYDGNVTTDANGEAIVTLPDYFETLNRDFRYQLTAIGAPGPNLYIAEEISGNTFKIAGGTSGMKVSWQVTGIRQDAWAEENRILVEEDKPAEERGYYLYPTLFGQPQERSVEWARDPDGMRELEERFARFKTERHPQPQ